MQVVNLFSENPFWAGFGNRETDIVSYKAVGLEENRIYIINEAGHVRVAHSLTCNTNYKELDKNVELCFPNRESTELNLIEANFWSSAIDVDIEEETKEF